MHIRKKRAVIPDIIYTFMMISVLSLLATAILFPKVKLAISQRVYYSVLSSIQDFIFSFFVISMSPASLIKYDPPKIISCSYITTIPNMYNSNVSIQLNRLDSYIVYIELPQDVKKFSFIKNIYTTSPVLFSFLEGFREKNSHCVKPRYQVWNSYYVLED